MHAVWWLVRGREGVAERVSGEDSASRDAGDPVRSDQFRPPPFNGLPGFVSTFKAPPEHKVDHER
jgi:hypothetical protein